MLDKLDRTSPKRQFINMYGLNKVNVSIGVYSKVYIYQYVNIECRYLEYEPLYDVSGILIATCRVTKYGFYLHDGGLGPQDQRLVSEDAHDAHHDGQLELRIVWLEVNSWTLEDVADQMHYL